MIAKTTRTLPQDNLTLRTHIIEECVPQLSLADLEAVPKATAGRWQELQQAQRRLILETHYAHLRALPAGTPLQLVASAGEGFARGDVVTIKRPLRPPSTNISVQDRNGKLWRFPMD